MAPNLMSFDLFNRAEKYISQIDGTDREYDRQPHGQHRRDNNFHAAYLADHRGHSH
jgi:hypothetical protein